jgi:hypothetical protein
MLYKQWNSEQKCDSVATAKQPSKHYKSYIHKQAASGQLMQQDA